MATAAAVWLVGDRDAFWVCVPGVLLACAAPQSRLRAAVSATGVMAAAAIPLLASPARGFPSPVLAVLIPSAAAFVLVATRERLEREREALRDYALTDPLTGIPNRRLLLAHAEYEIARHTRAQRSFALVMLDLDGFKLLNDRFGHAAGDDLLCDVAGALTRAIRAQDTVARIGGDEFCVLAPETDPAGTVRLAARISRAVAGATSGVETLSASLGIALFPDQGRTAAALLHAADEEMLSAKRQRGAHRARYRRAA